jgi:NADH-quinone oxidoreductase subunit C
MSQRVVERLTAQFGDRILRTESFRGDERVYVRPGDWHAVAAFLKADPECAMNHFTDLTAVDYPERDEARFEVILCVHSLEKRQRIVVKTELPEGQALATLTTVWAGADWAEREVWDMFGIKFEGHHDLRRVLLYEEFVGHPLRKDYPIDRTQPLVPYRELPGALTKLAPFGQDEGQPWGRIRWQDRLSGGDHQVSPAIAVQLGQRDALSQSTAKTADSKVEE